VWPRGTLKVSARFMLSTPAAAWDATAGAIAPHTDGATFTSTSNDEDLPAGHAMLGHEVGQLPHGFLPFGPA